MRWRTSWTIRTAPFVAPFPGWLSSALTRTTADVRDRGDAQDPFRTSDGPGAPAPTHRILVLPSDGRTGARGRAGRHRLAVVDLLKSRRISSSHRITCRASWSVHSRASLIGLRLATAVSWRAKVRQFSRRPRAAQPPLLPCLLPYCCAPFRLRPDSAWACSTMPAATLRLPTT